MSSRFHRTAVRDAHSAVPETCPAVDAAEEDAEAAIHDAASKAIAGFAKASYDARIALRNALVEANEEKAELEEKLQEAESEIESLKSRVAELERDAESVGSP